MARNQRERLFAALVAVVAEKGYEGTRVEDLLELSGVSRSAFYEHFSDKQDCLLAAVEAFVGPDDRRDRRGQRRDAAGRRRGQAGLRRTAYAGSSSRPAASRLCFVEIFAAGPRAVEQIDRATDACQSFVSATLEETPGHEQMPPEIVRATIGGLRKVIHTRLYRDEEAELLELDPADVGLGPLPTRRRRRRCAARAAARRPGPLASRATTRPSGSCARSPRSSPRRATRR